MKYNPNSLTKKERDCLIAIMESKHQDFPVRQSDLAKTLSIKSPTAFEILKRLESKGLIEKDRGMVILTNKGEEVYKKIVMVHRVMESLLAGSGVPADEACIEVQEFDYLMNVDSVQKIMNSMGNPHKCPHGKPIIEQV